MALLRRIERRNNSRSHLWEELENLDEQVSLLSAATVESNTGASGITTYNLPAATVGTEFVFSREASFEYRIDPNGVEYFQGSAAGAYKALGSDGSYINIKCLRAGIWHIMASFGTITDE
jgi:hypothetical protein